VKDVLAEDNVLGNLLPQALGKRVEIARSPVVAIARKRRVRDFYKRYARWAILRRQQLPIAVYLLEPLLNPIFLAAVALTARPCERTFVLFSGVCAAKAAADLAIARCLRAERFGRRAFAAVVVKDLLAGAAWAAGLVTRTVEWRGRRYRVGAGTVLTASPRRISRRRRAAA
jgi:hypothetical protein